MASSRTRRSWAGVATVAVLVAGCSSSRGFAVGSANSARSRSSPSTAAQAPASPSPPVPPVSVPPVPPVAWQPCAGDAGPTDAECATVQVPLDYANPAGRKIGIAMARHRATGARIGSLVINPGGPGASGIDGLDTTIVPVLSADLQDRFDIVTFDPRGVGRSAPVRCETGPQLDQFLHLDPAPTTDAGFQALASGTRAFDQGCAATSGSILPFVGTDSAARDMDEVRQAVGDAKLSYLGFSYGTFLGSVYAELFPTHIRTMVLDGALDPNLDPIPSAVAQAAGFDQQLNAFFAFCAATPTCTWKPVGDRRAAFEALMAGLAAHPIAGQGPRTVSRGEASLAVLEYLYEEATWPELASALQSAGTGDGAGMLQAADTYSQRRPDGSYSNILEANNAINCVDQPWPRDVDALRQASALAKRKAPEFGLANLYGGLPCVFWPAAPTGHPRTISAAGSPPIVVVGSTGDPATPYTGAQALAGQLQHGVLLTRVGNGHLGYLTSQCIRDKVDAYVIERTAPATGSRCPSP